MARKPRDPEMLREYLDALLSHFTEEELEPLRAEAARLKMSMHRIAERNLRRAGIFDFDWYCGWKQARAEANRQVVRALRAGGKK